jgi:hypothetical protein
MPRKLDFLPTDFQCAIAAVACYAALLDHSIEHALDMALFNKPNLSKYILKQGMQGDRLLELLKAIFLDYLPNSKTEISQLFSGIKEARSKRNDLTHGILSELSQDGKLTATSMRPHREIKPVSMTLEELSTLSDNLLEYSKKLTDLANHIARQEVAKLERANAILDMRSQQPYSLAALAPDHQDSAEPPSPSPPQGE